MKFIYQRKRKIKQMSDAGFGMIDTLIGVAILGVVIVAIAGFIDFYTHSSKQITSNAAVDQGVKDIEFLLGQAGQCKANFAGLPISLDPNVGAPVQLIRQFDPQAIANPLTTLASTAPAASSNLIYDSVAILPVQQISTPLLVSRLTLLMRERNQMPSEAVTRTIDVMMQIQSGAIQDCWIRQPAGALAVSQACIASTGGALDTIDPVTGLCTARNARWFDGDRAKATCPVGTDLPPLSSGAYDCKFNASINDPLVGTPISFPGGRILKPVRPPVFMGLTGRTCSCHYATDLPASETASSICQILCVVP